MIKMKNGEQNIINMERMTEKVLELETVLRNLPIQDQNLILSEVINRNNSKMMKAKHSDMVNGFDIKGLWKNLLRKEDQDSDPMV